MNQTEIRLTFTHGSKPVLEGVRRYMGDKLHRSLAEACRVLLREALAANGYTILPEECLRLDVEICSKCHRQVKGHLVYFDQFRQFDCNCGTTWRTNTGVSHEPA